MYTILSLLADQRGHEYQVATTFVAVTFGFMFVKTTGKDNCGIGIILLQFSLSPLILRHSSKV